VSGHVADTSGQTALRRHAGVRKAPGGLVPTQPHTGIWKAEKVRERPKVRDHEQVVGDAVVVAAMDEEGEGAGVGGTGAMEAQTLPLAVAPEVTASR
jgi:hypothetical protein